MASAVHDLSGVSFCHLFIQLIQPAPLAIVQGRQPRRAGIDRSDSFFELREPLLPRPVFDEMPYYGGDPVFPGISCQEMDLVEAWRKAGEKEKQIVKLTLGMK